MIQRDYGALADALRAGRETLLRCPAEPWQAIRIIEEHIARHCISYDNFKAARFHEAAKLRR